jgi:tetratricopeptide (TPR) repeat protein
VPPGEQERSLRAALALQGFALPAVRARALLRAGQVASFDDDPQPSTELFRESLALFQEIGDEVGTASALANLGEAIRLTGDLPEARRLLEESDQLLEQIGDRDERTYYLRGLAKIAAAQGDPTRARALLETSLALAPSLWCHQALGDLELSTNRLDEAESVYGETLGLARTAVARRVACYCLAGLAAVAALRADADRAGRLWGAVVALDNVLRPGLRTAERSEYERHLAAVRREPSFEPAVAEGRSFELTDALEYALSPGCSGSSG